MSMTEADYVARWKRLQEKVAEAPQAVSDADLVRHAKLVGAASDAVHLALGSIGVDGEPTDRDVIVAAVYRAMVEMF
jgi:hypothetical protein